MILKTKHKLLCLLLIICYSEVKATLDLVRADYDLYYHNPWTPSSQVPSKMSLLSQQGSQR